MKNKTELMSQLRIDRDDEPQSPHKWPGILAATLAVFSVIGLIWLFSSPETHAVKTQTARVASSNAAGSSVLDATGYVTPRRYATVSSKVTAKVLEVLVEEGMTVEEGQVVARLDDSNHRRYLAVEEAGLALAHAQLEETRARLSEAERAHERVSVMFQRQLVSESDLDAASSNAESQRAQLSARQAQVLSAQRRVELQQQELDDLVLRAPFRGVVISKDAQPGEMISPVSAGGGFTRTGICSIVDMDSLEIEVDVNESYIHRVKAGQPVTATLEAYPNWQIPARVIAIVPTADRQKATVRVRVGFEELDPRILPQMGVRVAFLERDAEQEVEARTDIIVPANALLDLSGTPHVYVVADGQAHRRDVTVERRNEREFWVNAGLSPGESYIITPPSSLTDGALVTVQ
ncbi:efflux RND transporter periplasmic adaptor subunit [Marinimicrobium sp. ABcell2]|uniref:efflux RND transporter periplasmic adaptor subunit n=1 Tax=Marinimicrobium sp. ABcell2 TaxID=3069751 RepID=UPI0027B0CBEA|nr:efflux RND transporter periplasmic adaptor subunit [Marinimicrobium sp. ABcell2]MDQ2075854.1 efflux RND transporter periplasmic adaptor subunit [Marinimicrobium sp. ABcell2]